MLLRQEKRCCQSESVDEPVAGTSTTTWKPKGTSRKALANTAPHNSGMLDAWTACLQANLPSAFNRKVYTANETRAPRSVPLVDEWGARHFAASWESPSNWLLQKENLRFWTGTGKPGKVNDLRKQTDVVQLRHSSILFLRDCSWTELSAGGRWNCDQSSACFHHFPSYSSIIHPSFIHHSSIIFHHFPSFSIIFHHFPSFSIIFHHFPSFSIIFHPYSVSTHPIPRHHVGEVKTGKQAVSCTLHGCSGDASDYRRRTPQHSYNTVATTIGSEFINSII